MWLLELGPGLNVASCAEFVNRVVAARRDRFGVGPVHRMTRNAGDLVASVATLDPPRMRGRVLVARQAETFRFHGPDFRGIHDVFRRG